MESKKAKREAMVDYTVAISYYNKKRDLVLTRRQVRAFNRADAHARAAKHYSNPFNITVL